LDARPMREVNNSLLISRLLRPPLTAF